MGNAEKVLEDAKAKAVNAKKALGEASAATMFNGMALSTGDKELQVYVREVFWNTEKAVESARKLLEWFGPDEPAQLGSGLDRAQRKWLQDLADSHKLEGHETLDSSFLRQLATDEPAQPASGLTAEDVEALKDMVARLRTQHAALKWCDVEKLLDRIIAHAEGGAKETRTYPQCDKPVPLCSYDACTLRSLAKQATSEDGELLSLIADAIDAALAAEKPALTAEDVADLKAMRSACDSFLGPWSANALDRIIAHAEGGSVAANKPSVAPLCHADADRLRDMTKGKGSSNSCGIMLNIADAIDAEIVACDRC
ncbi:MAG: hypothetical protein IMZ57_13480, partial [Acidobacteria bacterium]|nr:hypothetical protein [Acidobacteriota bacterium]